MNKKSILLETISVIFLIFSLYVLYLNYIDITYLKTFVPLTTFTLALLISAYSNTKYETKTSNIIIIVCAMLMFCMLIFLLTPEGRNYVERLQENELIRITLQSIKRNSLRKIRF